MDDDFLEVPTVEDRLVGSLARLLALRNLAELRAKYERPDWGSVEMFTSDTLQDLKAIERACEASMWGRATLASMAPSVPEGGRR